MVWVGLAVTIMILKSNVRPSVSWSSDQTRFHKFLPRSDTFVLLLCFVLEICCVFLHLRSDLNHVYKVEKVSLHQFLEIKQDGLYFSHDCTFVIKKIKTSKNIILVTSWANTASLKYKQGHPIKQTEDVNDFVVEEKWDLLWICWYIFITLDYSVCRNVALINLCSCLLLSSARLQGLSFQQYFLFST